MGQCVLCEKEILRSNWSRVNKKFCSVDCKNQYTSAHKNFVICSNCKKLFYRRPCNCRSHNFCSQECRKKFFLIKVKCVICSKEFDAPRCGIKRGQHKCCSVRCANEYNRQNVKRGKDNQAWRGGKSTRNCLICNKEFTPRRSQVKIGDGKFCSKKCYGVNLSRTKSGTNSHWWKPRLKKICLICDNEFEVQQRNFDKQKTCSRSCNSLYATRFNKYFNSSIERKIKEFLNENNILFDFQKRVKGIASPDFIVNDICIFADGDYWHNYPIGTDKDKKQDALLYEAGYKVLRFWERDINKNFNIVSEQILKAYKEV